jgi:hypothetical protein
MDYQLARSAPAKHAPVGHGPSVQAMVVIRPAGASTMV